MFQSQNEVELAFKAMREEVNSINLYNSSGDPFQSEIKEKLQSPTYRISKRKP